MIHIHPGLFENEDELNEYFGITKDNKNTSMIKIELDVSPIQVFFKEKYQSSGDALKFSIGMKVVLPLIKDIENWCSNNDIVFYRDKNIFFIPEDNVLEFKLKWC